jgi:hypothetical protein
MVLSAEVFSDAWVEELVEATGDRHGVPGVSGVVGLGHGKKPKIVLEFSDGKVLGPSDAEPEVIIPISKSQLEEWSDGGLKLTVAYMKGDVKPVGSTGALLAALEVLDNIY